MLYIKIMQGETLVGAEAHENPVYVRRQEKNNIMERCSEYFAQGILSLDLSTIYLLDGKSGIETDLTAYPIYMTEYEEIIANLESGGESVDPEDTQPEVPDHGDEAEIMTRADLTAKVLELEEQLAAANVLLGVE